MEDEINLRDYIKVLTRYGIWILATALVAAVGGFVFTALQTPIYEAEALVVITKPRYTLQFDPRLETSSIHPSSKAYPTLALGDDLLLEVMASLDPLMTNGPKGLPDFRNRLTASAGNDPNMIVLRARHSDPQKAAQIANTWADVFVETVSELYNNNAQDLRFFEEQLLTASETLEKAEQELTSFQSRNRTAILTAQIEALNLHLAALLDAQHTIERVAPEAAAIKARLAAQGDAATTLAADDVAVLLLQVEALSLKSQLPLQVQIVSGDAPSAASIPQMIAFLDGLMAALEQQSVDLGERIAQVEPDTLRLQGELQEFSAQKARLTRARDVAQETYLTLAYKVDEARIAVGDELDEARLVSHAAVPANPIGPSKRLNTLVAGTAGLILGIFGAFAIDYWRRETPDE